MLEMLAPFAPLAVLLLYALAGSFIRLFYALYKAYTALPSGSVSPGRVAMELLSGVVFGMIGGLLLDSMDVLKVGVGLGTVLCAVLGSSAIELVARKFGWTKKLETAVVTDEQLQMPDLNARQINALAYAKQTKKITNGTYQKLNNVSRESAKYDLSELVEKGRLKLLGSKKGSYYAPISSPNVPK